MVNRKWKELHKGEWPDNFIRFAFTDGGLKECDTIPHYDAENVEYAIKTINGKTRRLREIKDYFKNHISIHNIAIRYEISESTVKTDLLNIAHKIAMSVNLQQIMKDGDIASDDNITEEEILALKIDQLDLSTRSKTALHINGIHTVERLITKTKYDLSLMRNIGSSVIEDIVVELEIYGLKLKECTYENVRESRSRFIHSRVESGRFSCSSETMCSFRHLCKNRVCLKSRNKDGDL